jgi:hypothetical protein
MRTLLGLVARVYTGLALSGRSIAGRGGYTYPSVSLKDLTNGRVVPHELTTIRVEHPTKVERYMTQPGDVLVSARGTQPKVAIVPPDAAGAVLTSTLIGIRPRPDLLPEVLIAFFCSPNGQNALMSRARSGTRQIALSAADVAKIEVPVPPMGIQRRVAELMQAAQRYSAAAEEAERLFRGLTTQVAVDLVADRSEE